MQLNYYSVLGLKRTATPPEIKIAYKKLAIQYHPDKHRGDVYFEERFKQVSEAYQVLSNPQKRRIYDLKLEYAVQEQRARQQAQTYYTQQRRPASVNERYYRPIPKKKNFSKRDWQITIVFFVCVISASLLVKFLMDYVTAKNRFRNADTYMEQKQWASAHSLLSEAIDFQPKFADAYLKRAYINQNIYKNYEAAIDDYNAGLQFAEMPQADTYFNRGLCYAQLHNFQQAEADYTAAISIDADCQRAYFSRGEVRLLDLNKWPEAINDLGKYLKKPETVSQKNKALLYRGFGFYLTDKYDLAIKDYNNALKTDARNGRLYYLLGKAEYATDQKNTACNHFTQAYNLGYEPSILDYQTLCGQK